MTKRFQFLRQKHSLSAVAGICLVAVIAGAVFIQWLDTTGHRFYKRSAWMLNAEATSQKASSCFPTITGNEAKNFPEQRDQGIAAIDFHFLDSFDDDHYVALSSGFCIVQPLQDPFALVIPESVLQRSPPVPA